MRPSPNWLVPQPYTDIDLGVLKTGKEAQVNLIYRSDGNRSCLVAQKRYLPREVKSKGQLESMGVQRVSTFTHDVQYREGRQFRKSRDRRAVEQMSTYGKRLLQDRWTGHEHDVMHVLWQRGVRVPFPLGYADDVLDLEYVGDIDGAAPQLRAARLDRAALGDAYTQVVDGLRSIVAAGFTHGDLSAYNLLWWEGRVWFIDFPQAIDLAANPMGLDFLHRDVVNVAMWFDGRGVAVDAEELFSDLLSFLG